MLLEFHIRGSRNLSSSEISLQQQSWTLRRLARCWLTIAVSMKELNELGPFTECPPSTEAGGGGEVLRPQSAEGLPGGEDESAEEQDNWIKEKSYSGRHL